MTERFVIGCMSGTSMDAIDAAMVRIDGEGLGMSATFVDGASLPLNKLDELHWPLLEGKPATAEQFARTAADIGRGHAAVIFELLEQLDFSVDMIGVHGQTVYHADGLSLQLMNPHLIAAMFNVPVAFDFRGADIANDGQGAPITPLADFVLFRDASESRTVVNLGGFANFTALPAAANASDEALAAVRGGDICSCNQLLNHIARKWFDAPFDDAGARAAKGSVHPQARQALAKLLQTQATAGRSLGTGDEALEWADTFADQCSGDDLAATACHAIGQTIAEASGNCDRIIIAGGGANNRTLVQGIEAHTDAAIAPCDTLGVPTQYREAVCMAVLTALARDGVCITLPQVTGRKENARVFPCWVNP